MKKPKPARWRKSTISCSTIYRINYSVEKHPLLFKVLHRLIIDVLNVVFEAEPFVDQLLRRDYELRLRGELPETAKKTPMHGGNIMYGTSRGKKCRKILLEASANGDLLCWDFVLRVSFAEEPGELWNTGVGSTADVPAWGRLFLGHKYMSPTDILDVCYGDWSRQHLHSLQTVYQELIPCRVVHTNMCQNTKIWFLTIET